MKKGFTLIELLAVIVILAIIAVIAVPIVLNIIDESKENATLRSAEFYLDAVELAVADRVMHHGATQNKAYEVMRDGNICLETLNSNGICVGIDGRENNKDDILPIEVKGEKPTSGQIIIENGQIVNELSTDKTVKIQLVISGQTIVKNDKNEFKITSSETLSTPVEKICSIEKQEVNKYSVGDVVTCNIGEQPDKFYVIEDAELTAGSIQMLTDKNIHTTEYRQSDDTTIVGYCARENVVVTPIIDEYVNYLNAKLTGATGSLLKYHQAENLGCESSKGNCSANNIYGGPATNPALSWVYSTDYWIANDDDTNIENYVGTDGGFLGISSDMGRSCGVRLVITISTSDIQQK